MKLIKQICHACLKDDNINKKMNESIKQIKVEEINSMIDANC